MDLEIGDLIHCQLSEGTLGQEDDLKDNDGEEYIIEHYYVNARHMDDNHYG